MLSRTYWFPTAIGLMLIVIVGASFFGLGLFKPKTEVPENSDTTTEPVAISEPETALEEISNATAGDIETEVGEKETNDPGTETTNVSEPEVGIRFGQKALEISFLDSHGEFFALSDHLGEVVVVEFMATWCGVCKRQHEELQDFHEVFEDVVIVTVEVDVKLRDEDFQGWVQDKVFDWTVGQSPKEGWNYKVSGLPTVIVLDKEGIIRYRANFTSFEELSALVEKYH